MASSEAAPPAGTGKGWSTFDDLNSTPPAALPMGVNLVTQNDYGIIANMADIDQAFWIDEYRLALKAQQSQREAWSTFYSGFKMDDDSECRYANPNLEEFREEFNKYTKTGATELKEINDRILKYNRTKTLVTYFRIIEVIPLLQLCLVN